MAGSFKMLLAILLGAALTSVGAGAAAAATAACTGKAPPAGASVRGPVLAVLDGESLCVALGATPDHWIALRLAGAPHPARPSDGSNDRSRGALMAVAFSQNITCRIVATDPRAVSADCELDGRSIMARVRERDAMRSGLAWR